MRQLQLEIAKLKTDLQSANVQLDSSQQLHELVAKEKAEYDALAVAMDEESRALVRQASQQEAAIAKQKQAYEAKIQELQQQLAQQDSQAQNANRQKLSGNTKAASQHIVLSEELTRILIDQQLQEAGWQADSEALSYKSGARPEKGKNMAIAEWPTEHKSQGGRADYVLFAGLTPIAVVEAKKENKNVADTIPQAERYSKGFQVEPPLIGAWELAGMTIAWPDEEDGHYKVPFVYSCNGRPYVPQLAEQSGTWFRDVRSPAHIRQALANFHSPEGLLDKLKRSKQLAQEKLRQEPFGYLKLRDYQQMLLSPSKIAWRKKSAPRY